jgi:hypothetical protein
MTNNQIALVFVISFISSFVAGYVHLTIKVL